MIKWRVETGSIELASPVMLFRVLYDEPPDPKARHVAQPARGTPAMCAAGHHGCYSKDSKYISLQQSLLHANPKWVDAVMLRVDAADLNYATALRDDHGAAEAPARIISSGNRKRSVAFRF